jgi:hypothetical protein
VKLQIRSVFVLMYLGGNHRQLAAGTRQLAAGTARDDG